MPPTPLLYCMLSAQQSPLCASPLFQLIIPYSENILKAFEECPRHLYSSTQMAGKYNQYTLEYLAFSHDFALVRSCEFVIELIILAAT